ncbi:hypothetical protein [uncultured Paludibaculum sp.]|uniref:hypothetical protein n=1 Tax=uncultured Paludibaculum sp. TaxID=1765020 RepID=UPI002AABBEB6|nr:hypothetical protein [uncultured Paludibaculum sp.]
MLNLCLFAALLAPTGALTINVLEGAGSVVARDSVSPQRFLVQVNDAAGHPVPSVTVIFRLPAEGPSGEFASGMRSESVLTGTDGKAYVRGVHWNATPGKLDIHVLIPGEKADLKIPAEISASMPTSRHVTPKSPKKWIILAAVSGATIAGLAVAGGHKNASAAAPATGVYVAPPNVGPPVISIGKP